MKTGRKEVAKIGLVVGIILVVLSLGVFVYSVNGLREFNSQLSEQEFFTANYYEGITALATGDEESLAFLDDAGLFNRSDISLLKNSTPYQSTLWLFSGDRNINRFYDIISSRRNYFEIVIATSIITFLIGLLLIFQALYNLSENKEEKK